MSGLFSGLKVLDVASFIAAPAAATVLADFGADVIKIEPPGAGDPWRSAYVQPGMPESDRNYCWTVDSRNKRSLALDLKNPEGRRILGRLVAGADIFITNYPLQVRRRLGIAAEQLLPGNERLIYASFTAYGEEGLEADKPGFDTTAWWARSGLMDQLRVDGATPPAKSLPGMGDHPTAMTLFAAIVTALYRREKTGKGGHVGSSLLANGVWSNAVYVQAALAGARFTPRPPRSALQSPLNNHYCCGDGRWLMLTVSLAQQDKVWPEFCVTIGHPELAADPRFVDGEARGAHAPALVAILDRAFAREDGAVWQGLLQRIGVACARVAEIRDVPDDPQMQANGVFAPMAEGGERVVMSPFWIEDEDKAEPRPAPALGQHTDPILREAGFAQSEIETLRAKGAVA
ncbi:MAG TPA: CaiB/BaiF CoA-transferase family protein [Stellaceae bacterium]|nr:CaiB/BaiF CoA-transferase family protein [Stellaceae bacterium]